MQGKRRRFSSGDSRKLDGIRGTFLSYLQWYSVQGRLPGELGGSRHSLLDPDEDSLPDQILNSGSRLVAGDSVREFLKHGKAVYLDTSIPLSLGTVPEAFLEGNDGELFPLMLDIGSYGEVMRKSYAVLNLYFMAEFLRLHGNRVSDTGYLLKFYPVVEDIFVDVGNMDFRSTGVNEQRPVWEHDLIEIGINREIGRKALTAMTTILGSGSPPKPEKNCPYCRLAGDLR